MKNRDSLKVVFLRSGKHHPVFRKNSLRPVGEKDIGSEQKMYRQWAKSVSLPGDAGRGKIEMQR